MIKKTAMVIVVFIVLVFTVITSLRYFIFLIEKKEAVGKVLTYNVPNKTFPKECILTIKFRDEFTKDSSFRKINFNINSDGMPKYVNLYYCKSNNLAYTVEGKHITWLTFTWMLASCIIIFIVILLWTKELFSNNTNLDL